MKYGNAIGVRLDMASYAITESIGMLAKGDIEEANTTALIGIAESLISIGMVMYEERENRCGRYARGHQEENGDDHPEGRDVSGRKDPIQR